MALSLTPVSVGPIAVPVATPTLMYTAPAGGQTLIGKIIFTEVGLTVATQVNLYLKGNVANNLVTPLVGMVAGGYVVMTQIEGFVLDAGDTIYAEQAAGALGTVRFNATMYTVVSS